MTRRFSQVGLTLALLVGCCCPPVLAQDTGTEVSARRTSLVIAIERVVKSTVNIHTEKRARANDPLTPVGKKVNGMGTGVIIDPRGYIVTNYHVVQDVDSLQVTLHDKTTCAARVVSFDSREDLAIIKINPPHELEVMPMGTSSDLMLGEDVLAIGNAFGYPHTVTRGIISAFGRDVEVNDEQAYRNLIQIDAAINPGNSGGPLINRNGEMIAINVAIRAGAQKIGFAIPVDDARRVIARLLDVERLNQHYHGLSGHDHKAGAERKFVIDSVASDSPAQKAGLQAGDIITRSGDVEIVDRADFERSLLGRSVGEQVPLTVLRGDTEEQLTLTVDALRGSRSVAARQRVQGTLPLPPASANGAQRDDRVWEILGLKLAPLNDAREVLQGQSYRGGMRVAAVRVDSPAYQNGIREGDILVGLHVWETVNQENIDYVLNHPQFRSFSPLKFYILREKETLYGHFQIASR